jgi:hypothetical protein
MLPDNTNLTSSPEISTNDCHLPEYEVMRQFSLEPSPKMITHEEVKLITTKGRSETLVVNLFAGPGAGKSTTAAGIFFELKSRGVSCELALEYAKELVYEKRFETFKDQIYLFAKQYHHIFCLLGQVAVVVTDCPILLSPIYDEEKRIPLEQLVIDEHNKMWTYNTFINRKKEFNPKGRNHNEEQSKELDKMIMDILWKHSIPFEVFEGTPEGKDAIVKKILMLLNRKVNQVNQE